MAGWSPQPDETGAAVAGSDRRGDRLVHRPIRTGPVVGPGQAAASRLCGAVRIHGGTARTVHPPQGKDTGVVAGGNPFTSLTESWPGYTGTLAEMNGWPRWESASPDTSVGSRRDSSCIWLPRWPTRPWCWANRAVGQYWWRRRRPQRRPQCYPLCCRQCCGQFGRCPARTTMALGLAHVGFTAEIPPPNQGFPARFIGGLGLADSGDC